MPLSGEHKGDVCLRCTFVVFRQFTELLLHKIFPEIKTTVRNDYSTAGIPEFRYGIIPEYNTSTYSCLLASTLADIVLPTLADIVFADTLFRGK